MIRIRQIKVEIAKNNLNEIKKYILSRVDERIGFMTPQQPI